MESISEPQGKVSAKQHSTDFRKECSAIKAIISKKFPTTVVCAHHPDSTVALWMSRLDVLSLYMISAYYRGLLTIDSLLLPGPHAFGLQMNIILASILCSIPSQRFCYSAHELSSSF
jgi:hypothetical protein